MKDQILILRAQANKAAYRTSRIQKLAERWLDDVWNHEELRLTLSCPGDPVAARQHEAYLATRPADRYDVSSDENYSYLSGHVWTEIERQLISHIFSQAAFYDGTGGSGVG